MSSLTHTTLSACTNEINYSCVQTPSLWSGQWCTSAGVFSLTISLMGIMLICHMHPHLCAYITESYKSQLLNRWNSGGAMIYAWQLFLFRPVPHLRSHSVSLQHFSISCKRYLYFHRSIQSKLLFSLGPFVCSHVILTFLFAILYPQSKPTYQPIFISSSIQHVRIQ